MELSDEKVEAKIFYIRNRRVMLDVDLAKLYGVETKRLKEQVKRNIDRFPSDFMFEPNSSELASLRSQIATLEDLNNQNHIFKFSPFLFTENGIAMLSSVLNSKTAIQVNIAIMRIFTKYRSSLTQDLKIELNEFKDHTGTMFKIIFERLDEFDASDLPRLPSVRKKIGLTSE